MEKLVVAIVQSRHNKKLKEALLSEGFRVTELMSQGAFLGKRSSTFLTAVSDAKVESILEIIRKTCKRKSVFVADTIADPVASGVDLPLGHDSTRMEVGGALVFVLPIEKTERV
jgi:uncharacterized protein YaaQ